MKPCYLAQHAEPFVEQYMSSSDLLRLQMRIWGLSDINFVCLSP